MSLLPEKNRVIQSKNTSVFSQLFFFFFILTASFDLLMYYIMSKGSIK